MRKIFGYLLSPLFYIVFGALLIIFHPIQMLCYNVFGYNAHKKCVEILNFLLLHSLNVLGITSSFKMKSQLPTDRPIIFVGNHQNMNDIEGIIWYLRKYNPKFVSKIELAKGIPSISYNLQKSEAALIDRKNPKQALTQLARLGSFIHDNNYSAVIFPEGTRSHDGTVKKFQSNGIAMLLKKCPNALIVPLAINNTWKINQWGSYPLYTFENISWTTLTPIEPQGRSVEAITQEAEQEIRRFLGQ
jgi:1-acyl-sn-glycerol-3-phosphate acyltransferase